MLQNPLGDVAARPGLAAGLELVQEQTGRVVLHNPPTRTGGGGWKKAAQGVQGSPQPPPLHTTVWPRCAQRGADPPKPPGGFKQEITALGRGLRTQEG